MRKIITVVIYVAGLVGGGTVCFAQQVRTTINGLESDSTYMSLLREEATLKIREDSLVNVIRTQRQQLTSDTTNIYSRSQQILRLEEQLFDIRSRQDVLASNINSIEQEFILNNLTNPGDSPGSSGKTPSSNHRNLIENDFFKQNLHTDEYQQLKEAQRAKKYYPSLLEEYASKYRSLNESVQGYDSLQTPAEANAVYENYRQQVGEMQALENQISNTFNEAYNQEIYLYAFLLDKLNRMNDLSSLNQKSRNRQTYSRSEVMSVALAEMPGQLALILEYELALARALNLSAATDSLERAGRTLPQLDLAFPRIELQEKEFVHYEPVSFPGTSFYNTANPIPELLIPETGTYYSVTVGSFSQRQAVSVFRGAAPIAYQRAGSQWRYFAGLFRSYGDALDAVQELKDAGFRRPEPVRWKENVYENLAAKSTQEAGLWRIAITVPQNELPEDVRFALNRYARSKEVTRAGDVFYVGTFTDKIHVEEVRNALEKIKGITIEALDIQ